MVFLVGVSPFAIWLAMADIDAGRREFNSQRSYLLWTGWAVLAAYTLAALYSLRRAFPRRRFLPASRRKDWYVRILRTLTELEDLVARQPEGSGLEAPTPGSDIAKAFLADAEETLSKNGCAEAVRVELRSDASSKQDARAGLSLRLRPRWGIRSAWWWLRAFAWLRLHPWALGAWRPEMHGAPPMERLRLRSQSQPMAWWLRMHSWIGLAAGCLLLLHSDLQGIKLGAEVVGRLNWALDLCALCVVVTGVIGVLLWAWRASRMTAALRGVSSEMIEAAFRQVDREMNGVARRVGDGGLELAKDLFESLSKRPDTERQEWMRLLYRRRALTPDLAAELFRAQREAPIPEKDPLRNAAEMLSLHRGLSKERRRLRVQWWLMHGWRIVHVPASILLVALVALHLLALAAY